MKPNATDNTVRNFAWIQFTLARTTTLSQIVLKFTQTPRDDVYPLSIQINGNNVYTGTPPTTLGYVTLDLPPVSGNTVRISRTSSGSFPLMGIEFYEKIAVTPPVIANISVVNNQLAFSGTGGIANRAYSVLASPDIRLPLGQWTRVGTNAFDWIGNFVFTNLIEGSTPQKFYRIQAH